MFDFYSEESDVRVLRLTKHSEGAGGIDVGPPFGSGILSIVRGSQHEWIAAFSHWPFQPACR
jgi:hypothetical protein